jgi:hypothetical protein
MSPINWLATLVLVWIAWNALASLFGHACYIFWVNPIVTMIVIMLAAIILEILLV